MAFVILAHLLGWLWLMVRGPDANARRNWPRVATGFALAGIITLLLYAPMVPRLIAIYRSPILVGEVGSPRWALRETLFALQVGFGAWGAVASVVLFAVGLRDYWRQKWLVVTLVLLPVGLTAIGLVVMKLWLAPRFFFFLIGFGALIVARGAMVAGGWIAGRWPRVARQLGATTLGMILVGVVILANALSLGHLYRYPKQDYEGAMRYVEARRGTGDVVVVAGTAIKVYRDYYGKPWESVETPQDVQRIRSTARQVWVVHALVQFRNPELLAWIRRECRPAEVFPGTVAGGEVIVCLL
jgi:hypothetical protein